MSWETSLELNYMFKNTTKKDFYVINYDCVCMFLNIEPNFKKVCHNIKTNKLS